MKNQTRTLFLGLSLVLALILGCAQQPEPVKETTPAELSKMNQDFIKALLAKDAEAAANLYAEDASILPPNEPIVQGRDNIRAYWQGLIDAGLAGGSVATIATGSNGDLGYEIGRYQLQLRDSTGNLVSDKGKYTEILKRNADGKWMSICGIWNADE